MKLKINTDQLQVLAMFTNQTNEYLKLEIDKFMFRKKNFDLITLRVHQSEMEIFNTKLEILKIKKAVTNRSKLFTISISPIQSLLIITYVEWFKDRNINPFTKHAINQQKDAIYKELLTQ